MKLELGKYYMTRDGRKFGPMNCIPVEGFYSWEDDEYKDLWDDDGTSDSGDNDLIAEWQDYQPSTDYAAKAAQHHICITTRVGDVEIIYDGRN